jgi:hypothetical protein
MNRLAIVLALILAFALGGWIGDESRQQPDRPVLKFLAKAARWGLWLMVVGEPAPPQEPKYTRSLSPDHIDHQRSL